MTIINIIHLPENYRHDHFRLVLEVKTDEAELRRLEEALPGLQADTTALNTAVEEAPKP